jgi:hypothetical protein
MIAQTWLRFMRGMVSPAKHSRNIPTPASERYFNEVWLEI